MLHVVRFADQKALRPIDRTVSNQFKNSPKGRKVQRLGDPSIDQINQHVFKSRDQHAR